MAKRGQISFFIMVGIVIFIIYAFLSYINIQGGKIAKYGAAKTDLTSDIASLKKFVEICLGQTGFEATSFVASHGGYYKEPELGADFLFSKVPFYFYLNQNLTPTRKEVEESISDYIKDNIQNCINDFSEFSWLEIRDGEVMPSITLSKNSVFLRLDYQVYVKKGSSEALVQEFSAELPVRLSGLYDASLKITELQLKEPENICLSCLIDIAVQNNVSISLENYDEDTMLFKITLNTSLQNDDIIQFIFANKYLIK